MFMHYLHHVSCIRVSPPEPGQGQGPLYAHTPVSLPFDHVSNSVLRRDPALAEDLRQTGTSRWTQPQVPAWEMEPEQVRPLASRASLRLPWPGQLHTLPTSSSSSSKTTESAPHPSSAPPPSPAPLRPPRRRSPPSARPPARRSGP